MTDRSFYKQPQHYGDRDRAKALLTSHLNDGTLAVLAGSGISQPSGLPGWEALVRRCAEKAEIEVAESSDVGDLSPEQLYRLVDRIRRTLKDQYRQTVHDALYEHFVLDLTVLRRDVLITLGALTMRSGRGSVRDLFTLNFDNLLEWYLHLHGYQVQVVIEMPCLLFEADVRLYHLQGYLPHPASGREAKEDFVFSLLEAQKRVGERFDAFREHFRHVLETKLLLGVGLSPATLRDPVLGPILTDVWNRLQPRGIVGLWLFGSPISNDDTDDAHERGIAPLVFEDHDESQRFLLSVCQAAAENAQTAEEPGRRSGKG